MSNDPNSSAYINPTGAQGQNINGMIITPNGGDHQLLQDLIQRGAIAQSQPATNTDGSAGPRQAIENSLLAHTPDSTGGNSNVWGRLGAGLNNLFSGKKFAA